ncbi:hypothetical protein [Bacterioplanoides sp.]|uniref:hypothetical protein n=1 Tax=Bacterioplanoides sp. TaxID=2066072 RepID=UPI003B5BE887
MNIFTILFSLMGLTSYSTGEETTANDQLWIMIKMDTYFRTLDDLNVVDQVTDMIEGANLGYLDGHSSGAYQFDFNYYDVRDFKAAKSKIQYFMSKNYPSVEFTISSDYEILYEQP